ncbi:MAG: hypothetical protein QM802_14365 [Agriterribacter sp.]
MMTFEKRWRQQIKLARQKKRNQGIKKHFTQPLGGFRLLQIFLAAVCMGIPVFFRCSDKDVYYPVTKLDSVATTVTIRNHADPSESWKDIPKELLETNDSSNCKHKKKNGIDTSDYCGYQTGKVTLLAVCKDRCGFRTSLSDYVYSTNSNIFGLFYCIAAMIFIFNGFVYVNIAKLLRVNRYGPYYNIIIGFSLLMVVVSRPHECPWAHYIFTGLFFAGNIAVMAFLPVPHERRQSKILRRVIAVLIVAVIGLAIWRNWFSVLYAEWISLIIIAIHLIIEAKSAKLDGDFRNMNTTNI